MAGTLCCSKDCFSQSPLLAKNFTVITNAEGVGVGFFCYPKFWRSFKERETFTQKWSLENKKNCKSCVKVFQVYPVKYILKCFITKSVQKNTRRLIPTNQRNVFSSVFENKLCV